MSDELPASVTPPPAPPPADPPDEGVVAEAAVLECRPVNGHSVYGEAAVMWDGLVRAGVHARFRGVQRASCPHRGAWATAWCSGWDRAEAHLARLSVTDPAKPARTFDGPTWALQAVALAVLLALVAFFLGRSL